MGQYICMGSALRYYVFKKDLKEMLRHNCIMGKSDDEIKSELTKNFPERLYSFSENEEYYLFKLSEEIPVGDFIELYDEFNKIARRSNEDNGFIKEIRDEIIQMKSISEIAERADNNTINFWSMGLPACFHYHRVSMFSETFYTATTVEGVTFYMSYGKALCEDAVNEFALFTDFLRTSLKHTRLADTMLVYLSE